MTIIDQLSKALQNTMSAFSLISKSGLRWVYILPFLIYALVFTTGFSATNQLHDFIMSYFKGISEGWSEKNDFFSFLFSTSSVITWIIIKVGLFLVFGIISGYLTLIVLSPVYAWVSERTEEEVTGKSFPFSFSKFIKDVIRAIIIALRNGVIQLGWTIILLLLSFVPVVNLVTTPMLFIVTAYFYGFSFLDYSHERIGLNMKESILEVRRMKFASVSLGGIFLFFQMIPWIGPLFASLISFNLVVAGTNLVIEKKQNKIER